MIKQIALVFVGGGVGSIARFGISMFLAPASADEFRDAPPFPMGTLIANLVGCFLIGIAWALLIDPPGQDGSHLDLRLLIITGILGGFTTFSTFSYETIGLLTHGRPGSAIMYVIASCLGGIFLAWAGHTAIGWTQG